MDLIKPENWFEWTISRPLIIAGPCSAESQGQMLDIARGLMRSERVHLFRAGVWKPRSRPGSFNGEGPRALKWLAEVKAETGIRGIVEVASPKHIELCLEHGIDAIWIGSRTVSNPFSMDELALALRGVDIPVLVKNPLSPDVDLWTGAIERLFEAGLRKIAAIHRGFTPYEKTGYRNMPKWEVPIELRRRIPGITLICDPSHIAGRRDLVGEVAQKGLDLSMEGLMVEVHNDPENAMSDAEQQLTPGDFIQMLQSLIVRSSTTDDQGFLNQLEELRNQMDSIDHHMLEMLSQRMKISARMGEYKCKNNVTILQMERWLEILRTRQDISQSLGLDTTFCESMMKLIHQESIRIQTEVMNNLKKNGDCGSAGSKK